MGESAGDLDRCRGEAIDQHRLALRWFIRPYSYDSRTVTKNYSVPLHPGAERYYREVGYLK